MAGERTEKVLMKFRELYAGAESRKHKSQLLDQFCRLTGYHRKYAVGLLQPGRQVEKAGKRHRSVSYSPLALKVIEAIWRAAGYPWSVRLKQMLPLWLPWAKKHFVGISPEVEKEVLSISPRQIDRRLCGKKRKQQRRIYGRCKPGTLLKHLVPIRAGAPEVSEPGSGEMDLVTSCGASARGEFVYTLNLTDLYSSWCEPQAFLGRAEVKVRGALEEILQRVPFEFSELNSDNGSEFLNQMMVRYCQRRGIKFTRSRPYKKDDNAHIEQKNWTNVRKLIGWDRYDTEEAVAAMNDLYASVRLMMNLFQPCVKLVRRERIGSRLHRYYDEATTPLDRLVKFYGKNLPQKIRQLLQLRQQLDPFQLAEEIDRKQQKLFNLSSSARWFDFARPLAPQGGQRMAKEAANVR